MPSKNLKIPKCPVCNSAVFNTDRDRRIREFFVKYPWVQNADVAGILGLSVSRVCQIKKRKKDGS